MEIFHTGCLAHDYHDCKFSHDKHNITPWPKPNASLFVSDQHDSFKLILATSKVIFLLPGMARGAVLCLQHYLTLPALLLLIIYPLVAILSAREDILTITNRCNMVGRIYPPAHLNNRTCLRAPTYLTPPIWSTITKKRIQNFYAGSRCHGLWCAAPTK